MITDYGNKALVRYFAGYSSSIGKTLVVGVGDDSENAGDTRLSHEIARVDVTSIGADMANNRIIFKGRLASELGASIYEVGLMQESGAGSTGRSLFSFSDVEGWDGILNSTNSRTSSALRLAPAASGSAQSDNLSQSLDLSRFTAGDKINVAAYADTNANQLSIRLGADSSNYAEALFTLSSGYNTYTMNKSAMTVTGTVDWSNLTWARIVGTAKASGAAVIDVDSVRFEEDDNLDPISGLVARTVLSVPTTKTPGTPMDIEFAMEINVA